MENMVFVGVFPPFLGCGWGLMSCGVGFVVMLPIIKFIMMTVILVSTVNIFLCSVLVFRNGTK